MNEFFDIVTALPPVVLRGIIVGILVSMCSSLLGVVLVLKRYSMIGDGLSHITFGAMSLALVLGIAPLVFSVPVAVIASFFLLHIGRKTSVSGDSVTAAVSSTALAVGVAAVALSGGVSTGISDYMFGSIVAVSKTDMYICIPVLIAVAVIFVLIYNKIFALTFDESFSKVSGVKSEKYNMLIALLTALTVVIGMRIMGTLLISGLIVFPALCSMRVFYSFRKVVAGSLVISCVCFLAGTAASIVLDTPIGASIVIVNALAFCIFSLFAKLCRSA